MRFFLYIVLLVGFTSCGETDPKTTPSDSTVEKVTEEPKIECADFNGDQSLRINFVEYLEESDEYILNLSLGEDITWKVWYDSVIHKMDSTDVLYQEDFEYMRYGIPDSIAHQYWDTRILNDVAFYNDKSEFIGWAEFVRFEDIERNIASVKGAIFKLKDSKQEALFAIAGMKEEIPCVTENEPESSPMFNRLKEESIMGRSKFDRGGYFTFGDWEFSHLSSYDTVNYHISLTQLYANKIGDRTSCVMEFDDHTIFYRVKPISLLKNDYPVLLVEFGVMDSDVFFTRLLEFKNGTYKNTASWCILE